MFIQRFSPFFGCFGYFDEFLIYRSFTLDIQFNQCVHGKFSFKLQCMINKQISHFITFATISYKLFYHVSSRFLQIPHIHVIFEGIF